MTMGCCISPSGVEEKSKMASTPLSLTQREFRTDTA